MKVPTTLALVRLAREVALGQIPTNQKGEPVLTEGELLLLRGIWAGLDPVNPTPRAEAEAFRRAWSFLTQDMAERLAEGWDRYGAPTVAKYPEGPYFAHYTGPGGERVVEAQSKREAYREARRRWIRDLLDPA